METLLTKLDDYLSHGQNPQQFPHLEVGVIDDFKAIIPDFESSDHDKEKKKLDIIQKAFIKLPTKFLHEYSNDFFVIAMNLSSHNIYKRASELKWDFENKMAIEIKVNSFDDMALYILDKLRTQTSYKELFLYCHNVLTSKPNYFQFQLIILEILIVIAYHVEKKERILSELLPLIIRILKKSISKFLKYKGKSEDQPHDQISPKIQEYTLNYLKWTNILSEKCYELTLFLTKDLNQGKVLTPNHFASMQNHEVVFETPSSESLISHFAILFILDIGALFIDVKENKFLENEKINQLISDNLKALKKILPHTSDYLKIFLSQIKFLSFDFNHESYSNRDNDGVVTETYNKLTIYHPLTISYLFYMDHSQERLLLSSDYKIEILLTCINELFKFSNMKSELRSELTITLSSLLKIHQQNRRHSINNIHFINTPIMVDVIVKILDHSGGPIDPKYRQAGTAIYHSLKELYTPNSFSRFLVFAIKHSSNPSLTSFLISEFKSGVMDSLKLVSHQKIHEVESPFLNIQNLIFFVDMCLNEKSSKYIDDPELVAACVNILVFIFLKILNIRKEVKDYESLKFKDFNSIFNPKNHHTLMKFGKHIDSIKKKINEAMTASKEQESKLTGSLETQTKEDYLHDFKKRQNEISMILLQIDRFEEFYNELNVYKDFAQQTGSIVT